MTALLLFIVLPTVLLGLAFFIKPLVAPDQRRGDAMGQGLSAQGLFGHHGLAPDERAVREDTEAVRFDLGAVRPRDGA
ncbi:hypothetical protein [Deinococcus arcticus]|uniref:Uncharacterized protein n=1 Tax=Deinococcus arcticus TaxID=2136176 RepID=A0A2T3W8M4_9DEIO|nr:hypothetical protein [Deinococcus arcticus]PTA68245.1 hypothetical protein C8263_09335 [Deinococcus arcticus]